MRASIEPAIVSVPEVSGKKRARSCAWALLAITVFAGLIRVIRLWHPPLLIDECFTFWRVCGSYAELIGTLQNDGFVPLHYELLWLIGRSGVYLTPGVMRIVPVICGTLMVPAMYFLARQLFNRSVAITAAIFIACSAYAMFFSRDAKMYAPTWLFGTLSVACLLWWLRLGRGGTCDRGTDGAVPSGSARARVAWWAWVASGLAAAGFHAVTLLLLPLAPILLLARPGHHWRQTLMMVLGIGIIAAGPLGYYGFFNQWSQRSGGLVPGVAGDPPPDADWNASGLNWLGSAPDGQPLLSETASLYLTGHEYYFPLDFSNTDDENLPRGFHRAANGVIACFAALLALGLVPWPRRWRGGGVEHDARAPAWFALLAISAWIVVPGYCFFYCRSISAPTTPVEWLSDRGWWVIAGVLVLLALMILRSGWRTVVQLVATALAVLVVCQCAAMIWTKLHAQALAAHPEIPWRSIWHPRYVAIVMPAAWLAAAVIIDRLPTRPLRWLAIAIIAGANLANGLARVFVDTSPPVDRIMADIWEAKPAGATRTYADGISGLESSAYFRPIVAYNAAVAGRIKTSPPEVREGKEWPFRFGPMMERFRAAVVWREHSDAESIALEVLKQPGVDRVIVWDQAEPEEDATEDAVLKELGTGWRRSDQRRWVHRWYWTWDVRGHWRRREYRRENAS